MTTGYYVDPATLPLTDPQLAAVVAARLGLVEERLRDAVTQTDVFADTTARHLMNAGGKRLRPMLALLTAQLGDGMRPEVIDAAIVVELTHLATLYHDDVMDSAPTRRGAPSAHEVWGNSVAILTGDLLFARASVVVAGLGPNGVRIQAETFERLCMGQLLETVGPRAGEDPVEHYIRVLADKTGSLIATSARFGAMYAGCPISVVSTLIKYGEKVGVAFQLADDVIDLDSDASLTGKTPGTDLRERVPTMPSLLLRRAAACGDGEAQRIVSLIDGDLSDDEVLADIVEAIRKHGVLEEAMEIAREWARGAIAELAALPDSAVRGQLEYFARALVDRAA